MSFQTLGKTEVEFRLGKMSMPLRELTLSSEYRSDGADLVADFYTPCLRHATRYWRAVGYFTSGGLALYAVGLATFVRRGGKMQLVTGPCLASDDIEAIQRGYEARRDTQLLSDFRNSDLQTAAQDKLALLTWLVAHGHLDIKIACTSDANEMNPRAIYHEKIGIFLDDTGDAVAFAGSLNETVGGLLSNFESIDVYLSSGDTQQRVQQKVDNFKRLWDNTTDKLNVVDFPTALAEEFLSPQLVYDTTPSPDLPGVVEPEEAYLPSELVLRAYQREAIDAWFANDCRGLWEMATGTGKTITALSALAKLKTEQEHLFVLIACPYKHLVDQWHEETVRFGFEPIVAYENSATWVNQFNTAVMRYNCDVHKVVCVITTHTTFIGETMQKLLSKLKRSAAFVADEVHHLGAARSRQHLPNVFACRLGLSATPNRWFDTEGTAAIRRYFGETVYEFSLGKAIENRYLCSYCYHPHLVELTDEELDDYKDLTDRIARLYRRTNADEPNEALDRLLIKRATLLNKAENKLPTLEQLIEDRNDSLHHALFYCAPGQINSVLPMLTDLGLRVAKFTAKESTTERQELLEMFASGHLQALVAMRCLDEGVDVPSTQTAYILASSSNPKEFIQRRGRILRKAPGKEHAEIHDLIAVPPQAHRQYRSATFAAERKIVRLELKRFNEFAGMALNLFQARSRIWEVAKDYNLLGALGGSE